MVENINLITKLIKKKRSQFLKKINNSKNRGFEEKLDLIQQATEIACEDNIGSFCSSEIENFYLDLAQQNHLSDQNVNFKKNSILHVATEVYEFGGHTRVIERWIETAPKSQIHSVLLTKYRDRGYPSIERLKNAVLKKKGLNYSLKSKELINRGLELRKIALNYEKIILHIHPHDPIPLIAFGTRDFKRPVIMYNHAFHIFWLGVSISDIVADICSFAKTTSLKRRYSKSYIVGIPIDNGNVNLVEKRKARNKLNLPDNKKIIISAGSNFKYKPFKTLNFIEIMLPIIEKDPEIIVLVIGADKKSKFWLQAKYQSNGKIKALGFKKNNEFSIYMNSADLVVASIPLPSATTLIDAVNFDKPILTLENNCGHILDHVYESPAYCKTAKELQKKAIEILNSETVAYHHKKLTKKSLNKYHSEEKWLENIENLYYQTPNKHSINYFDHKLNNSKIYHDDVFVAHVFHNIIEKYYQSKFKETVRREKFWFNFMISMPLLIKKLLALVNLLLNGKLQSYYEKQKVKKIISKRNLL